MRPLNAMRLLLGSGHDSPLGLIFRERRLQAPRATSRSGAHFTWMFFELSQNPWILQYEVAYSVPGLLVLKQVTTEW